MEIKLEDLWEELEFEESLKEYVERKVDSHIERITEQTNKAIKTRIKGAIEDMREELLTIKGFAKCADTKINKHLISHRELSEVLTTLKGEEE